MLGKVLPLVEQEPEVREHYHNLWQSLHKYVHPSVDLVSRMMGESDLLVADSFDETWATEIIQDATEVFDLIWLATISRFPKCAPLLAQQEYGLVCPLTQAVLEKLAEPESGALMSEFRLTITTTIPFLLPAAQEPLNVPISKTNKAKVFITPKGSYPDPNVETTGKSVVRIECGHPFQGSFEEFCDHYGSVDAHEKLLDRTLNVLNRLIEVIRYRTPDVLRVIARRVGSFSIENIHVKASAEE